MPTTPVRPRCWDTASSREPADSFPMELDALGHHLVQCGPRSTPWLALGHAARSLPGLLAGRVVSVGLVLAALVSLWLWAA